MARSDAQVRGSELGHQHFQALPQCVHSMVTEILNRLNVDSAIFTMTGMGISTKTYPFKLGHRGPGEGLQFFSDLQVVNCVEGLMMKGIRSHFSH